MGVAKNGEPRPEAAYAQTPKAGRMKILYLLASASLLALIALSLAWELWLAPLHPGGSWLVLKVLPLLLPVVGILKGRRYTYQWASMLILFYFTEGVVRMFSNTGLAAGLARVETGLALVFFVAAMFYAKLSGPTDKPALRASRKS